MTLENFIPSIWSARALAHLPKALVFGNVCNRDYEGEIRQFGDSVRINQIGAITVSDYTKNTDLSSPEALTSAQSVLVMDKAKTFNFQVDSIDQAQANAGILDAAMERAAYDMADVIDQDIATAMKTDAAIVLGTVGTPIADIGTSGQAYAHLVRLARKLTDAKAPRLGRWVIVPPWYEEYLLLDDRFTKQGTPESEQRLSEGFIGRVSGMDIYVSHNAPTTSTTKFHVIAGWQGATSYAGQITEMAAYKPEKRFGDAMKALYVYGVKVVRATTLVQMIVTEPT